MTRYGYKKEDFEMIKQTADALNLTLVIDNSREGERRFAKFSKSFLTRKLNAAGAVSVYMMRPDFLPWSEKLVCEYIIEE